MFNTQYLLIMSITALLSAITLIILFNKDYLEFTDKVCHNLRVFIHRNESFFAILFLCLFFIEQLILVILVFLFKVDIDFLQIIISVFALIVVTTASLQKIILEIRVKHFKEQSIIGQKLTYLAEKVLNRYKPMILKKK